MNERYTFSLRSATHIVMLHFTDQGAMDSIGALENRLILENLSCPRDIMRFRLVYHGKLPASGNSPKPKMVADIRQQFHDQLSELWKTHVALSNLRQNAIILKNPSEHLGCGPASPLAKTRNLDDYPAQDHEIDLCEPLVRGNYKFMPLVRKSLDLNCELNILFLRQEDPGSLKLQAGDLDNRIKCLFDSLKVPDTAEDAQRFPPQSELTYCLMESDALIYRFEIDSDRLLFAKNTDRFDEVYLIIEVVISVLRVGTWNMALL